MGVRDVGARIGPVSSIQLSEALSFYASTNVSQVMDGTEEDCALQEVLMTRVKKILVRSC